MPARHVWGPLCPDARSSGSAYRAAGRPYSRAPRTGRILVLSVVVVLAAAGRFATSSPPTPPPQTPEAESRPVRRRLRSRAMAPAALVAVGVLTVVVVLAAASLSARPTQVREVAAAGLRIGTAGHARDSAVAAALARRKLRAHEQVSRSSNRPPTLALQRATKTAALAGHRQALHSGITRTVAPLSPQAIAISLLGYYGWSSDQFSCLDALWVSESGWNPYAENSSSGAYGIPQALPPEKMASAGADWRTNPETQIRWGLDYIRSSYGSPCGAWYFKSANGWY